MRIALRDQESFLSIASLMRNRNAKMKHLQINHGRESAYLCKVKILATLSSSCLVEPNANNSTKNTSMSTPNAINIHSLKESMSKF